MIGLRLSYIGWIAQNTWREAARQRLFHGLLVVALCCVVGARGLREFNFGAPELKFLADCGFGAMAIFGAALAIGATVQLVFSELENRTVHTLLAKSVSRAEFTLGKLLGIMAVLGSFCGLLTGVLLLVLGWREHELLAAVPDAIPTADSVRYGTVLLAGALQWLKLSVLAAFTLLVASFVQGPLLAMLAGFVVLVAGHLQALALETYQRAEGPLEWALGALLATVVPDFQVFNWAEALIQTGPPPAATALRVVGYGIGYLAVLSSLAVVSFQRREL